MMRYCSLLLLNSVAFAQSTSSVYMTDVNGRRAEAAELTQKDGTRTERTQSINGRERPVESVEQRVLRDDSSGKTTETLVRKYDGNGQLASTIRTVKQEQKDASGNVRSRSTTYLSEANGPTREIERANSETRIQGGTQTEQTAIERPNLNGSFELAEKRDTVTQASGAGSHATEKIYRKDVSGGFQEAVRRVTDVRQSGDQVIEQQVFYEPGVAGQLRLSRQSVSTTTKRPDGSEVSEVNLYASGAYGVAQEAEAPQQIKEQQLIERKPAPGGAVIEKTSVRRPSIADPKRLGEFHEISEIVCRGKCDQVKER